MKHSSLVLAAIIAATCGFAVSAHAEDFSTDVHQFWGESVTDASGNFTSPDTNTSVSGGVLSGPIQTDGTQTLANQGFPAGGNEVTNYIRTFANTAPINATSQYNGTLLGNLSGKTSLSATFNISNDTIATGDQFQSSELVGEGFPNAGNTGPLSTPGDPSIRLTFTGTTPSTDVWFSNGSNNVFVTSMDNGKNVTLTVNFDPSDWSNINGVQATADTADFDAALSNVTRLGLAFGSGDFFSNGFAFNTGGTAAINLDSISTATVPLPASAWSGLALLGGLGLYGAVKRHRKMA